MGKQWKVTNFIFLCSKITADGDCSHEIKRHLFLGRKIMTNLENENEVTRWLFATPWTIAYQAPPSMGFSRQEYWSGFSFLLQEIFPTRDQTWVFRIVGRHFTIWATRDVMTNLDRILKSRHYFTNIDPYSQSYGFSSSHVWMWELYHKEGWTLKNWCFWTVVLEKTLESPLDCKIKPVLNIHWRKFCWNSSSTTLASWCKQLTY